MARSLSHLLLGKWRKPTLLGRALRAVRRLQPLYWLRTHTVDRYHMVDCGRQYKLTGYRWGWTDVDHLMLLALFELFMRFVEDEDGLSDLAYQVEACPDQPERRRVYAEAVTLHWWWTVLRPKQHEPTYTSKVGAHIDFDRLDAMDTEMMRRLIAIRGSLWT